MLEFKQEQFLKPYIERNTNMQREIKKEGTKIKKQNLLGKLIENPVNKVIVKIATTRKE